MDCFGTYFAHVQSCDVTRVQSGTERTALVLTLNFQWTLVEGLNLWKRRLTKKTDPYLQKKKTLICKKKDPYLKKKDPYFWSYINSIFDFLSIFQKIISDFFVFKPLNFSSWLKIFFVFVCFTTLPPTALLKTIFVLRIFFRFFGTPCFANHIFDHCSAAAEFATLLFFTGWAHRSHNKTFANIYC